MDGPLFTTTTSNRSPNYQPNNYTHPCPHCPRFFACPHNVLQHCRAQHSHLGYSRVQCPVCPSDFSRPFCFYRHMLNTHEVNIHPGQGRVGQGAPRQPVRRGVNSAGVQRRRRGAQRGHGRGRGRARRPGLEEVVVIDLRQEREAAPKPVVYETEAESIAEPTFETPTSSDNAIDPGVLDRYIMCPDCYMIFDQQVELQEHQHNVHGMLFPEQCSCFACWEAKFNRIFGLSGAQHQEPQVLQMPPSVPPQVTLPTMPQTANGDYYFQDLQSTAMPYAVPQAVPETMPRTVPQIANNQYDFQGLQSMTSMQEALPQSVQETAPQLHPQPVLPTADGHDYFEESQKDAENDSGIGFGSVQCASPEQQLFDHEEAAALGGGDDDGNQGIRMIMTGELNAGDEELSFDYLVNPEFNAWLDQAGLSSWDEDVFLDGWDEMLEL